MVKTGRNDTPFPLDRHMATRYPPDNKERKMSNNHIVILDAGSIGDDISWPDFASLGSVRVFESTKPGEVTERIKGASIVLTNKVEITAEHIAAAPELTYIGTLATGYNQVDGAAAATRKIPVCNVPAYSTPAVVQHVFALLFSLAGGICTHASAVAAGEWSKSRHFWFGKTPVVEMHGKTLGVVGYGDIGSTVARVAHHMGMNVLAHAPRPKPTPEYTPFAFTDLATLFRESDAVTIHCPLSAETQGMVNRDLLRTMQKSAYLINCGRGPVVNDADLAEALHQGVIAGAGLDVVGVEPMPDANPLRTAPNCLITPHIAWASVESRTRLMQGVFDNIVNFMNGKPTNVRNGL